MTTMLRRTTIFVVAILLSGAFVQSAQAQIWKKAQEKLKEKLEEKAAAKADSALERAADEAATEIVNEAVGTVGTSPSTSAGAGAANQAAAGAMMQAMAGTGAASAGEPVDFRALKALLPDGLPGFTRTDATGQKSSALGIKSSSAEATYESGDRRVTLTITDMGTLTSWAMLGYGWMNMEMDSETETGYERTSKYKGYPAHETFEQSDGYTSGSFSVIVGQRFVVQAEGDDAEMSAIQAAIERVDLAELEALGAQAQAEAASTLADFRALKELLPEGAGGLPRTSLNGQQTNALGILSSMAEARYESGDRHITATVTDLGSLSGITMLGYAWMATQIDAESDHGFERTVKYGAHPGYQKYEHNGDYRRAELQVVVGNRYVVSLQGQGVEMADLEATLGRIDLDRLASL